MVELLAPAGQIDSGYAAFAHGADAVYLGLTQFSARAEAQNFTPDAFAGFVKYAHENAKRVLVAVNTVFFENEKESLIDTLQTIESAGADGVIVQDIGTARLMKRYFPNLRMHGSTQMAVHNREGVEALRDMGFKRVVLARELTLDEIRDICRVPGIEKEVFIHGALCYSYSGLCLFSAIYAGRSANRGKCVYPCREAFTVENETKHVFSMKDMAQNENVRLLEQAGVTALKIEGRKKSPLYVAAVTDYYRSILDGCRDKRVLDAKRDNIRCVFSRPTTDFYLKGRKNFGVIDTEIVGHRGLPAGKVEGLSTRGGVKAVRFKTAVGIERFDGIQIDLPKSERPFGFSAENLRVNGKNAFKAAAGETVEIALPDTAPFIPVGAAVYLASSGAVKRAYPFETPKAEPVGIGDIDVAVSVRSDLVSASAFGATETAAGTFSPARSADAAQKAFADAFSKTGGTGLTLAGLSVDNPDKLFVPLSVLNDLRRRLYERAAAVLSAEKQTRRARQKEKILHREALSPSEKTVETSYIVKTDDALLAAELMNEPVAEAVFEIGVHTDTAFFDGFDREKIRFALPAVARAWETAKLEQKARELLAAGFKKFEIANVWGLTVFKGADVDLNFDWPVYAANSSAARMALELGASGFTVSPETPDPSALFAAFPDRAAAVVYQDIPLFTSENCPYAALHGKCRNCGGNRRETMTSRYGTFVSVMKDCRHFLLAEHPVVKKREAVKNGAKKLRVEFMRRGEPVAERLETLRRLMRE